ncbi:hypothetical protein FOTG_18921 [Fusarium oxysporum f. sp. vasinfectum 25433]|uniref:Uncharacterized protein n=1 Tax=Fusarium oxysporum f. sp. vasinfectum 25433 TaxID=1089449 RepID=X0KG53_FUSOX|nr:hypothetical protein FOTG_18921 [Fusarium oxysporum f. sp. vasinfectum 25433]
MSHVHQPKLMKSINSMFSLSLRISTRPCKSLTTTLALCRTMSSASPTRICPLRSQESAISPSSRTHSNKVYLKTSRTPGKMPLQRSSSLSILLGQVRLRSTRILLFPIP